MKTRRKQPNSLLFATLLIFVGLACNAATNLGNPPTPTNRPPTITPLPPSLTALPPTSTSTSTPVPAINCAEELSNVLASVIPDGNAATELRGRPDGEEKNDFYPISVYRVSGEKITLLSDEPVPNDLVKFQEQKDLHQKVWDYYVNLIPKDQRSMLGEFVIITDGKDKLLAAVQQTNKNLNSWALEVDIADTADPKELTYTLIHEYAHLLTLNSKQVTPSRAVFDNPGDQQIYSHKSLRCDQYFSNEGCSQPDSYLNSFYTEFWTDIYDEWSEIHQTRNNEQFYDDLNDFYHKYQNRFVTDYAVVNPVEDIAESISFFILSPKPTGDSIAEKKILFFNDFPELTKLRNEIQKRICSLNP